MMDDCIAILEKYNIIYKDVKEIKKGSFEVTLDNDKKIVLKNINEKEKNAWEYKTLFNLKTKMKVPEVYKVNGEYIKEATVIEEVTGHKVKTYEEREYSASMLGSAIGLLHVSEINEQSSEEELKKIWEKHILTKTLYFGTKIIEIFNKDFNEKIFTYLNENMHYVKEDYDLAMIIGSISNDDYVVSNEKVILTNFENSMVGDPIADFALIYDYFYDNKDQIAKFLSGYKEYMSLPDNFEAKLPFYKLISVLDRVIVLSEDKENNKEEIERCVDTINAIIDGRYVIVTQAEDEDDDEE